jgi:hypothetical protein
MITVAVAAIFACALALYLLPVLVGAARHVPDLAAVAVVNIFAGWTVAGWLIALVLALRSAPPAVPYVQVVQAAPPAGLPPAWEPPAWPRPPALPPYPANLEDPSQR